MTARPRAWPFYAAVFALAGWFVFVQIVRGVEPLALDQGLFACFGRWIPRGVLPYRDLFDSKPPLFLSSYGLARAFPGGVAASLWWLEALWLLGSMAVAFGLAARLWGRWAGLSAAALLFVGLWAPDFGGFWSRAQAEELLVPALVGAAWAATAARTRPRAALACGVLTGLVGLYKVPALACAVAWPMLWLGQGRSAAIRRILACVAGAIVPWLLTLAWFALRGGARDLLEAVFVYQTYHAAYMARPWLEVVGGFLEATLAAAPGLLLLAGVGLAGARDRAERRFLAVWMAAAALAIVAQRQLAEYHYLLLVPPLALLAARGTVVLAAALSGPRRIAAAVGMLCLLVLAMRAAAAWNTAYAADWAYRRGLLSRRAFLRRFERGAFSPYTEEAAAAYLRAHTRADEGVLVWGLSPGIYALADRHPVTRYPFHQLLLTEAPLSRSYPGLEQRRADFLARLSRDPPRYVLVGTRDANGFEPEDSYTEMLRFPAFRGLIERDYARETELGSFLLYRRR